MSWFSKYLAHPALSALSSLAANPAIAAVPEAKAAVETAQKAATTIASTTTTQAAATAAAASAAVDPVLKAFDDRVLATADAALVATLGPVGGEVVVPGANALIEMLEQRGHDLLASLFAHAKTQVATPKLEVAPA